MTATTEERADTCDRNWIAAFAALVPHIASPSGDTRRFGRVKAVVTGLSRAFYNPVFVTDSDALAEDVSAAVAWIRSRNIAASVQLRLELARYRGQLMIESVVPEGTRGRVCRAERLQTSVRDKRRGLLRKLRPLPRQALLDGLTTHLRDG